jgi:cell division protein FtsW
MLKTTGLSNERWFFLGVTMLVAVGLVMVFSSSYLLGREHFGNSFHFIGRQILFCLLGIGFLLVIRLTKFEFWMRNAFVWQIFATILVLLTFVPGIGVVVKGSHRWIDMGPFHLQPGEILKYTTLLCSVRFFQNFVFWESKERLTSLALLIGPPLILVFQPDFGMFMLCMMNIFFVAYMSSFPRKFFYAFLMLASVSCSIIMIAKPYRVKRLFAFLDPWQDPQNSGFQVIQSLLAFSNGSWFGLGIGNSREKLFYLPEAHNDFILSVISEELGFVGFVGILFLYMFFLYHGFKIATRVLEETRSLFALTAVFSIGFQALLNICVTVGMLPTKGLNLPFISYGGSSLVANFVVLGLYLSAITMRRIQSSPV